MCCCGRQCLLSKSRARELAAVLGVDMGMVCAILAGFHLGFIVARALSAITKGGLHEMSSSEQMWGGFAQFLFLFVGVFGLLFVLWAYFEWKEKERERKEAWERGEP